MELRGSRQTNSRFVLLCVFVALVGLLLAAVAIAVSWTLLQKSRQPEFVLPPVVEGDVEFLPLPAPTSHFTVSVEIPFRNLERAILSGKIRGEAGGLIEGYEVSWGVTDTRATVRREGTDLLIEGRIGAELHIDEELPFLLELLGTTFQLDIGYSVRTGLWLREDWALEAVPSVQTTVHKALKPSLLSIFEVDIRDEIAPYADAAIHEVVDVLEHGLGPGGAIEVGARAAWAALCTTYPLFPEANSWVELTPSRPRATPLRIDSDAIRLQVRFDVAARVAPHPTQPSCPFPERLVLVEEVPALADFSMPIFFDYETLRFVINQALEGGPRVGPVWFHEVQRLEKRGSDVLVTVTFLDDFTAELKDLPGMDSGFPGMLNTAHVLAEIRQDPDTHQISLANVRVDTEAGDFLSNTLLEAVEPWLGAWLEEQVVLEPSVLGNRAEAMLNSTLRSAGIRVGLGEFSVTGLEPGSGHLRGLVTATGTVDVSVPADYLIPFD